MKIHTITIALLFCCLGTSWGQNKYITLREAPLQREVSGFYIAEVLDLREQRDSIGFERIRATGEQLPVKLARGLAGELYTYLKQVLPEAEELKPVTLGVEALSVAQEPPEEGGRKTIFLQAIFYVPEGRQLRRLMESQQQVNGTSADATEALIRAGLGQALAEFSASEWRDSTAGETVRPNEIEGAVKGRAGSKKRMNLLAVGHFRSRKVTGWSADYFHLREPIPEGKGWFIPYQFRFERFRIEEADFLAIEYIEARLNYGFVGVSPFRRIIGNLYLGLSFKLIVGGESLTDTFDRDSFNLLLGVASSQGLYWIPRKDYGLVLSVGLYERLLSSQVYRRDIGLQLSAGLKF